MNELQVLNVNATDYEITDGKARDRLTEIEGKQVITDVKLNATYDTATKTLSLSLTTTKGGI